MKFFFILFFVSVLLSTSANCQNETTSKNGNDRMVYTVVEQMPEFPGGQRSLETYLVQNLRYPSQAVEKKIEGRVFVTFIVGKLGDITDIAILKGVSPELNNEAIRVVRQMPTWKPGKQFDKEVEVKYTLPITFKLQDVPPPVQEPEHTVNDEFKQVDKMPEYPGGIPAFIKFTNKNLKQPKGNFKTGIVVVEFKIDSAGVLSDFKVTKHLSPAHDEEALRVVKMMPDWIPGSQNGIPVPVRFSLPIKFK